MIGLDTNVLVRYLAQDDKVQSPKATRVMEALRADEPGHVTLVVLVELVWVLARGYGASREEICKTLETLLQTKEVVVAQADVVWKALRVFKAGSADFADCLIERLGANIGSSHTVTFDLKAAKGCGMHLIE